MNAGRWMDQNLISAFDLKPKISLLLLIKLNGLATLDLITFGGNEC